MHPDVDALSSGHDSTESFESANFETQWQSQHEQVSTSKEHYMIELYWIHLRINLRIHVRILYWELFFEVWVFFLVFKCFLNALWNSGKHESDFSREQAPKICPSGLYLHFPGGSTWELWNFESLTFSLRNSNFQTSKLSYSSTWGNPHASSNSRCCWSDWGSEHGQKAKIQRLDSEANHLQKHAQVWTFQTILARLCRGCQHCQSSRPRHTHIDLCIYTQNYDVIHSYDYSVCRNLRMVCQSPSRNQSV